MKQLDEYLPEDLLAFNVATAGKAPHSTNKERSKEKENSDDGLAGTSKADDSSSRGQEPPKMGEKSMADSTINKDDIRKEVVAYLAEKDAENQVTARISALEAEKAELAQQLEEATAAKDTLSSDLETAKAELSSKTQECEALATEKEESIAKAAEAEKQLVEIREEQAMASRTAKLEEVSLLLAEGEKRDAQLAKVKTMSEEAFASYVEELTEIKVMASATVKDDKDGEDADKKDKVDANDKTTASDKGAIVAPANVEDGQKFAQSVAAASAQVSLEDDKVEAYASM